MYVQGDCSGISATEPYNDYAGAMKCMLDGADVAFVKHATPLDTTIVPLADQVRGQSAGSILPEAEATC